MEAAREYQVPVDAAISLHVLHEPCPGKPALVLSSSIAADLRLWEPQMPELRGHASIVRYDQRGHGLSGVPDGSCTIDQLGGDVLRVMDHLGVERAVFCGLSLGGLTGLWLGIHHPERLAGLVLVNTAPSFPAEVWIERAAVAREQGMAPLVEATLTRWFTPGFIAAQPRVVDTVRRIILSTPGRGYAACGDALRGADIAGRLGEIRCPVRVIAGRYDPATPPARSEEIVRAIEGAELATLEAAHLCPVEAARPFGALLRDFLARHGEPQPERGEAAAGIDP